MSRILLALSLLVLAAPAIARGPDSSSVIAIADANNRFCLDLYQQVRGQTGNLAFSPYSISSALAMTYTGARGQTEQEMARVLHFAGPQADTHSAMHDLRNSLEATARKDSIELLIANRLWGEQTREFLSDFLELTKSAYGAELERVSFRGDAEGSRQIINRRVADQTRGRIVDLLSSGSVNDSTRLVLTNAIYFKGSWAKAFEKARTRQEPFHEDTSHDVMVPMMHETLTAPFTKTDDAGLLLLPYAGEHLSMVIVLPDQVDGLLSIEKGLTRAKLDEWISSASPTGVQVSLPRFRTTTSLLLGPTLMGMGMPSAFDRDRADFTGMARERGLYISLVVHKAFVEVTEEGTEAAAATGVTMSWGSIKGTQVDVSFTVDHPFLFLIRDNATGTILFMGRITNPLS